MSGFIKTAAALCFYTTSELSQTPFHHSTTSTTSYIMKQRSSQCVPHPLKAFIVHPVLMVHAQKALKLKRVDESLDLCRISDHLTNLLVTITDHTQTNHPGACFRT